MLTDEFRFTDEAWNKIKAHLTFHYIRCRNPREVLEAAIYVADFDGNWNMLNKGMPGKLTIQKFIQAWNTNGSLAKVFGIINRGSQQKKSLDKVRKLLLPGKPGSKGSETKEQVVARQNARAKIVSTGVKPKNPEPQVEVLNEEIISFSNSLNEGLDSIAKPLTEHLNKDETTAKLDDAVVKNYGYDEKAAFVGKPANEEVKELGTGKPTMIELDWAAFLDSYAKAHWRHKRSIVTHIETWVNEQKTK
jgi:hypothetical protein